MSGGTLWFLSVGCCAPCDLKDDLLSDPTPPWLLLLWEEEVSPELLLAIDDRLDPAGEPLAPVPDDETLPDRWPLLLEYDDSRWW